MVPETKRTIFRSEAMERYVAARERAILPRLVYPPVFVCLWLLISLVLAGSGLFWFMRVPAYATGTAVVVDARRIGHDADSGNRVVAFLPADQLPYLRAGQTLFVELAGGERSACPIVAVEPAVASPEHARQMAALSPAAVFPITQPAAVVIARFAPVSGLPASSYPGSVYRAEIEIGSRRLVALLPAVGRLFRE